MLTAARIAVAGYLRMTVKLSVRAQYLEVATNMLGNEARRKWEPRVCISVSYSFIGDGLPPDLSPPIPFARNRN